MDRISWFLMVVQVLSVFDLELQQPPPGKSLLELGDLLDLH